MEQLALVILFALIAFIQWVIKKSVEVRRQSRERRHALEREHEIYHREPEPAPVSPPPQPMADSEAMRRLREALGLPDDAPAPQPVRRVLQPPPLPETPRPAVRKAVIETPRVVATVEKKSPSSQPASAPKAELPKSRVRELLASSGGLRDAVVLSEILGRPKGAQI